jgi:hypothetical protein
MTLDIFAAGSVVEKFEYIYTIILASNNREARHAEWLGNAVRSAADWLHVLMCVFICCCNKHSRTDIDLMV